MKKSEKDDLKKAFNIPEPQHKDSFISSYNEMLKKNEKKFNIPVFFRWTSTAVFAVLIIGVWGNLSQNADFLNKFTQDNPNIIDETTTTTAPPPITAINTTVTITATTSSATQQTAQTSDILSTPETYQKSNSTVTTINATTLSSTKSEQNTATKVTVSSEITVPAFEITETAKTIATTHLPVTTTKISTSNPATTQTTKSTVNTTTAAETTTKSDYPVIDVPDTTDSTNSEPPATIPDPIVPMPDTTTTTNMDYTPAPDLGKDYTVTPSVIYKKTDNVIDIEHFLESNTSQPPEPGDSIMNVQGLFDDSDYIVLGEIDEIIYTQINGKILTQENITIYNVLKGDTLMPTDKISIYMNGGYMSFKDFSDMNYVDKEYPDNYSVYDSGGNNGVQNVGDMLLFCIKDGTPAMPDGAFMLTTANDISVFKYENKKYTSIGNSNISVSPYDLL